jgi:hypothetical protein
MHERHLSQSSSARQRLGKTAATNAQAKRDELVVVPFYMQSVQYQNKLGNLFFTDLLVSIFIYGLFNDAVNSRNSVTSK